MVRFRHTVFTIDQYADTWPEQFVGASEAAARLLLPAARASA
jgi:hypothetical protein